MTCMGKLLFECCRYKSRLYSDLGLNLWIIKLQSSLTAIEGDAASYATGVQPHLL